MATFTHPSYAGIHTPTGRPPEPASFVWFVQIGDEVALATDPATPIGVVTAIYLDGMVELSTGDQVPAADLVLIRRGRVMTDCTESTPGICSAATGAAVLGPATPSTPSSGTRAGS